MSAMLTTRGRLCSASRWCWSSLRKAADRSHEGCARTDALRQTHRKEASSPGGGASFALGNGRVSTLWCAGFDESLDDDRVALDPVRRALLTEVRGTLRRFVGTGLVFEDVDRRPGTSLVVRNHEVADESRHLTDDRDESLADGASQ